MHTPAKQPLRSTDAGYVPVPIDALYRSLCEVTDILDALDVTYIVTGGTLLGAMRQGDLFAGDTDWDLEIIDTDLDTVLGATELFAAKGLQALFPLTDEARPLAPGGTAIAACERRIVKICDTQGRFHGDLFVHTLFTDGILRRVSLDEGVYWNAKMTFPVWFMENRETVDIRGRKFACAAHPELSCARIYGPDWRLPKTRHNRVKGYNFAGAHLNANIEKSVAYALAQGWVPRYPDAVPWPHPITHTSTPASARWIGRHEHLEIASSEEASLDARNAVQVLTYRSLITKLKRSAEKTKQAHQEALATVAKDKKKRAAKVKKATIAHQQEVAAGRLELDTVIARHADDIARLEHERKQAANRFKAEIADLVAAQSAEQEQYQAKLQSLETAFAQEQDVQAAALQAEQAKLAALRISKKKLAKRTAKLTARLAGYEGSVFFLPYRAYRWLKAKLGMPR